MGKKSLWSLVLLSAAMLSAVTWVTLDALFGLRAEPFRSVEIPNFCGQTAEEIAFEDYLEVRTEYRYDAEVPSGVVISQTPGAGNRRKLTRENPHCKLLLVVSLGEERVVLPNVIGQDARSAAAALRELGVAVKLERKKSAYPEGSVFEMSLRAGTEVPKGSTLTLTVSDGIPSKTPEVPDVRGLSRSDALVRIWLAGLTLDSVKEIPSEKPSGIVIDQSLRPGSLVAAGSGITLTVSREEQ